jgi:hypothetical protein
MLLSFLDFLFVFLAEEEKPSNTTAKLIDVWALRSHHETLGGNVNGGRGMSAGGVVG